MKNLPKSILIAVCVLVGFVLLDFAVTQFFDKSMDTVREYMNLAIGALMGAWVASD